LEVIVFLNQLYMDDKVVYIAGGDMWNWSGNWFSFQTGNVAMFIALEWQLHSGAHHFPVGVVPFPQGPSGRGKSFFKEPVGAIIPRFIDDPTTVYKIFEEYQYYWEGNLDDVLMATRDSMRSYLATDDDASRLLELNMIGAAGDEVVYVNEAAPSQFLREVLFGATPAQVMEMLAPMQANNVRQIIWPMD
jgi:ABC-type glycerol-3-phosphate transport system substrate-binding protein